MQVGKVALRPGAVFVAVALLLLLNIIVIPSLTWDIWVDEFHTLESLGAPPLFEPYSISGVVSFMAEEDPVHPPGYFVLLSLWGRLAGWSVPVLRSLSLFAGLLALALLFHLARRNFSLPVALLALIFTGFNVAGLHMLRDMRSYMLLQLAVTLMLFAWSQLMNARRVTPATVALFLFSAALVPWVHYFGLYAVLALALPLALGNLVPVLRLRYLFYLWPGLGLLAAIGGDRLRRVHPAALILPAMWVLALLWQIAPWTQGSFRDLIFHGMRPPYSSVVRQLQGLTLPEDVLVWHRNESRVDHANHLLREMLRHATAGLPLERRSLVIDPSGAPVATHLQSRDEAFRGAGRAWLAWEKEHRHWRLGPLTEIWLPQQGYRRCNVLDSPQEPVRIELWAQVPDAGPGAVWRFVDDAGREVSLRPGAASPAPTGDGQHYTLFWDSGLPHGYSAGLYRLDANGGLQAQLDVGLEGAHGCHGGTLAGVAAPGDSLWLGVYDWRSGARLTPLDVEGENNLARID